MNTTTDMTTNTDGAMPELPEPYARHAIWNPKPGGGWDQYHDAGDPMPDKWDDGAPDLVVDLYTADQMRDYARAAIQQAAGAVPEGAILQRMKYHHRAAEPEIGMLHDDFDLYDMDIECAHCIDVLIVRADAVNPAIDGGSSVHLGGGEVQKCSTCGGSGWRGGPSYYNPGEGGEPCADCEKPPLQPQDAKDAQRYRWLREHCDSMSLNPPLTVAKVTGWGLEGWSGDDLSGAIDTAMASEEMA